jgi:hypothetical protein
MARTRKHTQTAGPGPLSGTAAVDEGAGPDTGGQSGDTQGLSGVAGADSESVKELAEEGQYFEAAVVSGIENVPDADVAEVTTKEISEDDVPTEYLERDQG